MNSLEEKRISCPYCGENIVVLLDYSVSDQQYIEDCQVCCRPINFLLSEDLEGHFELVVLHENE